MEQVLELVRALRESGYPHPVAIRPGHDGELGTILEADAFDVPDDTVLAAQTALANVLWPHAFSPTTVLTGAFDVAESAPIRSTLAEQTVWYVPDPAGRSVRS